MLIREDLLILLLAATISFTSQSPCKISIHCFCKSIGNNITFGCVEEDTTDEPCRRWPGCEICPTGQECLKCSGDYPCTEATPHEEKHRQKRQSGSQEEITYCDNPGPISNGNKVFISPLNQLTDGSFEDEEKYPQGGHLVYSCNDGYDLAGEEALKCEPEGYWSSDPPSCKKEKKPRCDNHGPILNGRILYVTPLNEIKRSYYSHGVLLNEIPEKIPLGGTFLYSCDCGYELYGDHVLVCGPKDRWMLYPPSCEEETKVHCDDPGPISNGKKVHIPPFEKLTNESIVDDGEYTEYYLGALLWYSCSYGYKLEGEEWLSCDDEETWSSDPPSCVKEEIIYCDKPEPISNGNQLYIPPHHRHTDGTFEDEVNNKIPQGGRLMYSCDDGYYLEGDEVLTCGSGDWKSEPPTCEKEEITYCDNPGPIPNGRKVYISPLNRNKQTEYSEEDMDDRGYPQGSHLEYSCNYGYELKGKKMLKCKTDGFWTADPPSCKRDNRPMLCSNPGPILNGQILYLPAPSEKRKGPIPVPDEEEFLEGATLKYACNSGYAREGIESITCESSGYWSGIPPLCNTAPEKYIMHCDNPGSIVDGRVVVTFPSTGSSLGSGTDEQSRQYPEGTILRYTCEDGYHLHGPSQLTCHDTSFWSDYPPTCRTDCGLSTGATSRRITNGAKTLPGDWPWVVAIAIERTNGYKEKVCGGALWSSGVVVTAAHCLTDAVTYILYFGKVHLDDSLDDADVQVRTSTQAILHPSYNSTTYEFDIGIVMFEPRITFSNRVRPVCPPTAFSTARNLKPRRDGYVTGFGETGRGVQADSLLLAIQPYQTTEACMEAYRSQNLYFSITRNMFCAGFDHGRQSTCSGDSGSGLTFYNTQTRRFNLEGIVSFGVQGQCGMPKKYTVYTKVFPFVPWIISHLV